MSPRLAVALLLCLPAALHAGPPNILLVITDDQGYGDLGCHGNPKIQTPHLDKFAGQSLRLESFYVSPVCTPTRASLMTGRYNYRTGAIDTYLGRALMHPDETTLAEILSQAGYRTGIFGKWHLGDNYPLRALDQGFQEALVHKGGGLAQPSDPPGNGYFDPILMHNGKAQKYPGYCTDIFTDAALEFIGQKSDKPFFAYVAYNCPHDPLQVSDELVKPYRALNLAPDQFPRGGHPLPGTFDAAAKERIAKVYAMVSHIDSNVGRLLAKLDRSKLADDTIVIFMTDNGPASIRYNAGMLERKGSVHEGGIRVPCYWRWPEKLRGGHVFKTPAAHIDILPTLLEACGVKQPEGLKLDGISLWGEMTGKQVAFPRRTLYFQWHRGEVPQLNRAFAARGVRYKLVQPLGVQEGKLPDKVPFKLFDMENDPLEEKDLAATQAELVLKMRTDYEAWFKDVGSTRGYAPVRIHVGSPRENPTTLTRQDWRGPKAGWTPTSQGFWEIEVSKAGTFTVTCEFPALKEDASVTVTLGKWSKAMAVKAGARECVFKDVVWPAGPGRLEGTITSGTAGSGVHYVHVDRHP